MRQSRRTNFENGSVRRPSLLHEHPYISFPEPHYPLRSYSLALSISTELVRQTRLEFQIYIARRSSSFDQSCDYWNQDYHNSRVLSPWLLHQVLNLRCNLTLRTRNKYSDLLPANRTASNQISYFGWVNEWLYGYTPLCMHCMHSNCTEGLLTLRKWRQM